MITAPFGMRKGLFSLFMSFKSLDLIAFLTSLRVIVLFIFLNSLNLRLAATFIEHLKKNFISALGNRVPMSLPSIITSLFFANSF